MVKSHRIELALFAAAFMVLGVGATTVAVRHRAVAAPQPSVSGPTAAERAEGWYYDQDGVRERLVGHEGAMEVEIDRKHRFRRYMLTDQPWRDEAGRVMDTETYNRVLCAYDKWRAIEDAKRDPWKEKPK